jgi:hypothetical protein
LGTVHTLFTSLPSRPASGLRLETARNLDKKKSEFYFLSLSKKILTEKPNRASRKSEIVLLLALHLSRAIGTLLQHWQPAVLAKVF